MTDADVFQKYQFDARPIVRACQTVVPNAAGHHDPCMGQIERDAVARFPLVGYDAVDEFEARLRQACDVRHAIAVSSGTAALHLALLATGVSAGDVVLVPTLTFAATAAAVCHIGASPVFLDADAMDFGIHPHKFAVFMDRHAIRKPAGAFFRDTGQKIAALVFVHVLGLPCRFHEIRRIAADWGVPIIEDAAEALGSNNGRPCGSLAPVSILSFNLNKIVTTGGGGAVLTDDATLAKRMRHMATTARIPHAWLIEHDGIGWNYRMPNSAAAIGCAQMKRLPMFLRAKRALHDAYRGALGPMEGVEVVREPPGTRWNRWLTAILVHSQWRGGRNALLSALHDAGLRARAVFTPLHTLAPYRAFPSHNPETAMDIHKRLICLPSGNGEALRFL